MVQPAAPRSRAAYLQGPGRPAAPRARRGDHLCERRRHSRLPAAAADAGRSTTRRDLSLLLARGQQTKTTVALSRADARELHELLATAGIGSNLTPLPDRRQRGPKTGATTSQPLQLTGELSPHLSRGLWLVKWLLAIPHFIALVFLWIAYVAASVIAFFAILFTGSYPRRLFDFNVGVLRWTWRVGFYSCSALATDQYPPVTLKDVPDYPARLEVAYPESLSRRLVLVKSWLLAIPHYFVIAVFVGGAWAAAGIDRLYGGGGLVGLLVLFAGIMLLFTSRYPKPLCDFVLGMNRWAFRVAVYATLMTDAYPPFRLDMATRNRPPVAPKTAPCRRRYRHDCRAGNPRYRRAYGARD